MKKVEKLEMELKKMNKENEKLKKEINSIENLVNKYSFEFESLKNQILDKEFEKNIPNMNHKIQKLNKNFLVKRYYRSEFALVFESDKTKEIPFTLAIAYFDLKWEKFNLTNVEIKKTLQEMIEACDGLEIEEINEDDLKNRSKIEKIFEEECNKIIESIKPL